MRSVLVGAAAIAATVLVPVGNTTAAVLNGVAIGTASQNVSDLQDVDCRRYPHRHSRAIPHGFGFGCPKKGTTTQPKPKTTAPPPRA
jgi:hypothetical protein